MTPEAQRIAIAEACGWRCTASFKEAFACWVRPDGMDHQTEWLPDYLEDLNAMHEAEDNLLGMNKAEFAVQLCRVVGRDWPSGIGGGSFAHIHATSAQRAEAFLRTIGKWEDDK